MNKNKSRFDNRLSIFFVAIFGVFTIGFTVYIAKLMNPKGVFISEGAPEAEPFIEEIFPYKISPNSSFYNDLRKLNIDSTIIHEITKATKPVMDLSNLRAGTPFQIFQTDREPFELTGIKFKFSPYELLEVTKTADGWIANKIVLEITTKTVTFGGIVTSSLWESAEKAKMNPNLISELAEIFAWEVDFSREVRVNDRWRLSIEQQFVRDQPIGYGAIIAAEYINDGEVHSAVLFKNGNESLGYFSPNGENLKRMFLKSPIKYGRISSRFNRARFHPILKYARPHLGVDYAAPIGTPIRAIGDGTITSAGYNGGAGKMIKLRHNSSYQTAYKHLSGFAKGIRTGARVHQGQVIGYVGTTGLSTGPHLHFEFFKNGSFVDPLRVKFPAADPIPSHLMAKFQSESVILLKTLPDWSKIDGQQVVLTPNALGIEVSPPTTRM